MTKTEKDMAIATLAATYAAMAPKVQASQLGRNVMEAMKALSES